MTFSKKYSLTADQEDSEPLIASSSSDPIEPPPTYTYADNEENRGDKNVSGQVVHFPDTDVYIPPGGEEPPPEFTPYEAEYFVSGGNVVSHDKHLNEDGEALYRFLLSQAQTPPSLLLSINGTHTETRWRTVTNQNVHGQTHTHQESYTETITDFDFIIDVGQHIVSTTSTNTSTNTTTTIGGPVHWSLPDEEPAYRGKMYKEVDGFFAGEDGMRDVEVQMDGRHRRKATKQENKSAKAWEKDREARGLPPWVGPATGSGITWNEARNPGDDPFRTNVLKSSKTLREWADEYCASRKRMKEFTYEKVIYGWNLFALETAIEAAIRSTYYTGSLTIEFKRQHNKIHVRPDSRLARTLSNKWLRFLLWITLIFPFIWLYKRFAKQGGGRWEVCGGAYALKCWYPIDPFREETQSADGRVVQTNAGTARLIGMREGEWFQQWEGSIKRAVTGRLRTSQLLQVTDDAHRPTAAALLLDGYTPS